MGIFSAITSRIWSSSAPSGTQDHRNGTRESEEDGRDVGEDQLGDRMDIDGDEDAVEEKAVSPQHAPRPVLPHSNAFEEKKKDSTLTGRRKSDGNSSTETSQSKHDNTPSRPPLRPQSSWRPIPSSSFRGQSPAVILESHDIVQEEGKPEKKDQTPMDVDDESEDEPTAPTPWRRKSVDIREDVPQRRSQEEEQLSAKKAKKLISKKKRKSLETEHNTTPQPEEIAQKPKRRKPIVLPAIHINKVRPAVQTAKDSHRSAEPLRQDAAEDDSGMVALLNKAIRRKASKAEKQQRSAVPAASTPSMQPPGAKPNSWKAVNGSSTSTPQVIIRSQPRPSLLSTSHTPSKASKTLTKTATTSKAALEQEDVASNSSEATSASNSESEEENVEPVAPSQTNKRKATTASSQPAKRHQTEKQNTVRTLKEALVQDIPTLPRATPVPVSRPPIYVPESTPQRILPPASIFRFRNSQSHGTRQSTPMSTPEAGRSAPRASSSVTKATTTTPATVNSGTRTRILPAPSPFASARRSSLVSQPSNLRQSSMASFVSTGSSSGDIAIAATVKSSQPSALKSKKVARPAITPSVKGKEPALVSANSKQKLDRVQHEASPRSNVKRKRRMPDFDIPDSPPVAMRTPHTLPQSTASAAASGSGTNRHSVRRRDANDGERNLVPITIPSNARLLSQGLDDDTLRTLSEAVTNFGRHQELSQFELNAVVQRSLNVGDQLVKDLWEEVCGQVPEIATKHVHQVVRRHFHNYIRGPWSEEQDEELRDAFQRTPGNWVTISEEINRFPEDARLRYRDYASKPQSQNKDVWTLEEEEKLRSVYNEYMERIRAEKAITRDQALLNASDESLIDWNAVSAAMGHTRNRIQCFQKWKRIQSREESDSTGLGPLSDVPWRVEQALRKANRFSAADKLGILHAIRDTGATSEYKVPWRLLMKDLGLQHDEMNLAVRVLFRNLRGCVRRHQNMKLQDILTIVIEAFEDAAPDEPDGFDRTHSSVLEACKSTPSSTSQAVITSNSKRYSLNNTPSSSSSKKRLKTYSSSKLRRAQNTSDEDEDEVQGTPVPAAEAQRKVRDRMRNSDIGANKHATPQPATDGGEDIADELRMTWTRSSITPRSKKPIVKPRISQPVVNLSHESSEEEDDEEHLNPSPLSEDENEEEEEDFMDEDEPDNDDQLKSAPPSDDEIDEDEEDGMDEVEPVDEEMDIDAEDGRDDEGLAVHSSEDESASEQEDNLEERVATNHTQESGLQSLQFSDEHESESYSESEEEVEANRGKGFIDIEATVTDDESSSKDEPESHTQGFSQAKIDVADHAQHQSSDEESGESESGSESDGELDNEEQEQSEVESLAQEASDMEGESSEEELEQIEVEDVAQDASDMDEKASEEAEDNARIEAVENSVDVEIETASLLSRHANRPVTRVVSARSGSAAPSRWQAVKVTQHEPEPVQSDFLKVDHQSNGLEDIEVKDEEASDNEVLSSLPESRRTSRPPENPVEPTDSETSSTSESGESDDEEDRITNGVDVDADRFMRRSSQSSQRYWSPPPPQEPSEDEDSAAEEDDAEDIAVPNTITSHLQRELSSPTPSSQPGKYEQEIGDPSIYAGASVVTYPNSETRGVKDASPVVVSTQQTDDDHHITMNGWSPKPLKMDVEQDLYYTSASDDEEEDEDADVDALPQALNGITNGVHYSALPQSDDDSNSSDEDEEPLPKPVSKKGGAWTFERWQQERDAHGDSSNDSDSDVSSIRADAVPESRQTGREESLEL